MKSDQRFRGRYPSADIRCLAPLPHSPEHTPNRTGFSMEAQPEGGWHTSAECMAATLHIANTAASNNLPLAIVANGSLVYSDPADLLRDVDLTIVLDSSVQARRHGEQLSYSLGVQSPHLSVPSDNLEQLYRGSVDVLRFKYIILETIPFDISVTTVKNVRRILSPLAYYEQRNLSVFNSGPLPPFFLRALCCMTGHILHKQVDVERGVFTREPGIWYVPPPVDSITLPIAYYSFLVSNVLYDGTSPRISGICSTALRILVRYGIIPYNLNEIYDNTGSVKSGAERTLFRLFERHHRFSPTFRNSFRKRFLAICTHYRRILVQQPDSKIGPLLSP